MQMLEKILGDVLNPGDVPGALFYAVVFFIIAMIFSRLIRVTSTKVFLRSENELVDRTIVMFMTQFAQIAVYVVGLVIFFHIVPALNKLGSALLTGVSIVSVVFGLAAQNTLSNLVAGCTLLLYRPFHIDDLIQVATPTGTEIGIVERLTLGYTMLRTMDDRLVVVPNSLMASQVSLNLNRRSLYTMMIMPLGVKEIIEAGKVRTALLDLAEKNPKVHRIMSCRVQALEDGSAYLSLRVWCNAGVAADDVQKEITTQINEKFGKDNILLATAA